MHSCGPTWCLLALKLSLLQRLQLTPLWGLRTWKIPLLKILIKRWQNISSQHLYIKKKNCSNLECQKGDSLACLFGWFFALEFLSFRERQGPPQRPSHMILGKRLQLLPACLLRLTILFKIAFPIPMGWQQIYSGRFERERGSGGIIPSGWAIRGARLFHLQSFLKVWTVSLLLRGDGSTNIGFCPVPWTVISTCGGATTPSPSGGTFGSPLNF